MTRRESRNRNEGRRSWRFARSPSNAVGSKKPYLVVLTLLLLASLGLYWWAMQRTPNRNAHLAVIEIPANRRIATTPFLRNDVQRLLDVRILRTRDIWTNIRDDADFADQIGPQAAKLLSEPYDNLILYINAPGISVAGQAYLTHSDFLAPDVALEGKHAVRDLLTELANAGTGVKLLVLDSTSVDVDPRLGMVVNEFVRLVEADVKQLNKDSNLYVLLPAAPFQVSTTAYGDRQSLFGKYLVDGLAGEADRQGVGDGNLFVTLYELYEYVRAGCASSINARLGVEQTPVLLQAGVGYVPPTIALNAEQLRLAALSGKKKPPPATPAEPTKEKSGKEDQTEEEKIALRSPPVGRGLALAWQQPTSGPKTVDVDAAQPAAAETTQSTAVLPESSEAAPDTAPESPPAPPPKPPAKLTPQQQLLAELEKAWRLRDAIQDPRTNNVTPITFAPHLWRALEAELLFVERQMLADPVFTPSTTDSEAADKAKPVLPSPSNVAALQELVNAFTTLQEAISSRHARRSPANDRSLLTRLLKAWDRYVDTQLVAEEKFIARDDSRVVQLSKQARQFDTLVHSLPYYVRWHARAHQSLSRTSNQHERSNEYLESILGLAATLRSLRTMSQLHYNDQHKLEQVGSQLAQLASQREALDEALWEVEDRDNPIIAERLLSTPLLDADRRMQLVRLLVQAKPPVPSGGPVPSARQSLSVSAREWQQLHAHCNLELRLVELALGTDNGLVKSLADELQKADSLISTDNSEANLWVMYRQIGALFGQCYSSLPQTIIADATQDYSLYFVDHRDVDNPRNSDLDTRPPLQLLLPYEPEVKVEIAEEQNRSELALQLGEIREVVIKIRTTRERDASEPLQMQVDSALLAVERGRPGPPEKKTGWYEQTVVYQVRAKPGVTQLPGRATTDMVIWSAASEQLDRRLTLAFSLPRPDQISLEVWRLSTASPRIERELDSAVTLGVFPSNLPELSATEFQFRVRNEAGEAKKIRAELYLVKQGRADQLKHGAIDENRRRQLYREAANSLDLSQLELVAEVNDLEVAMDASAVLAFKPPGMPAADATNAVDAVEKPTTSAGKDASYGMVCVLRDESGKPWVKWIELEPSPLYRYVTAQAGYESGRVVVNVRGTPDLDGHFPAEGLHLAWDIKPDFPDGAKRRSEAQVLTPGAEASLYVEVEPDGITREVYIAVNGCPRVLSFRVPCRDSGERIAGEETRIDRRSIAITRLSIPGTPQVFHLPTRAVAGGEDIYLDGPPPGTKVPKEELFLERRQPVIVAMPIDALRVHFHLDAPVEGLRPERGDAVELLMDGDSLGKTYSDRHLASYLLGIGDNGIVRFALQMQEQFIDIKPRDRDEALTLIGELTVDRRRPETSQAIPIIFDGTPPVIKAVNVPTPLDFESKQAVELEVDELSGVTAVRYWFSVTQQQSVDEPVTAALLGPPARRGELLHLRFNVDTTGIDEGDYFLAIEAEDRVNLTSRVQQTRVQIKKKIVAPVIATIAGSVQFSSAADYLFTSVQLLTKEGKPVPGFETLALRDTRFAFMRVPAGEYIVRAEIKKGGSTKQAEMPIQVEKSGVIKADLSLK